MLIPRFSIRWLMIFTAVSAIVFVMASAGLKGQYWSAAIVIGIAFLLGTLLVHGVLFTIFWTLSLATRPRRSIVLSPQARPDTPPPTVPPGDEP